MSIREEIMKENRPRGVECMVCFALRDMNEADAAELAECLADSTINATAIARVLGERGYPIHAEGKQIRRHRKSCNS
jgi:hypothetical protein